MFGRPYVCVCVWAVGVSHCDGVPALCLVRMCLCVYVCVLMCVCVYVCVCAARVCVYVYIESAVVSGCSPRSCVVLCV